MFCGDRLISVTGGWELCDNVGAGMLVNRRMIGGVGEMVGKLS